MILTSGDIADSLDRSRLGVYQFSLPKAASMSSLDSLLQSKSTAVTLQTGEREKMTGICVQLSANLGLVFVGYMRLWFRVT